MQNYENLLKTMKHSENLLNSIKIYTLLIKFMKKP